MFYRDMTGVRVISNAKNTIIKDIEVFGDNGKCEFKFIDSSHRVYLAEPQICKNDALFCKDYKAFFDNYKLNVSEERSIWWDKSQCDKAHKIIVKTNFGAFESAAFVQSAE